jgi:glycosyltransferase involved in cell wall biosynthesis
VKVSVVIPAWRAEHFVGAAIASARAQTLADIEIIVVNDCSPDDTAGAIARAGAGDPRVRAIDLPVNRGPSGARNRGFEAAQGEWIAVLDADDAMAPDPSRQRRRPEPPGCDPPACPAYPGGRIGPVLHSNRTAVSASR